MDVKRSRSPRAPAGGEDDKKRAAGWRGSGVRPEMVLVGFLLTLPLLFLVFGGRWGSTSSSLPASSSSTPSSHVDVPKPVTRHVAAGDRGATPQSQSQREAEEACASRKDRALCMPPMDARAPRTPWGAHKVAIGGGELGGGSGKGWRWRGWRAPARVEVVVVVGFTATLTFLVVVFGGGGTGSLAAFPSPGIEFVQEPADIQDDMFDDLSPSPHIEYDRLLGGLLIEGFDEKSCRSRYQFARYHNSPSIPSPYLIDRLRKQEALQKKCGPGTKAYKEASKQLRSGQSINTTDCNYLLLTIHAGLGNRMLEITSAFLYSLLTNRILLVDRYKEIGDLFCEPFPGTSWLVPSDFPLNYLEFTQSSAESYGNMLQNKVGGGNTDRSLAGTRPHYVYLHLDGNYGFHDKLFFCEDDQQFLQGVPWLIIRTDMYFVPSLFLIPAFQDELSRLFPEKDTVFHHLARYLFHPTNNIWYSVTKYYRSYLAKAEKRVGIQIRIYETKGILQRNGPFPHILNQILSCAQNEKLLPEIGMTEGAAAETQNKGAAADAQNNRTIAVLTTSLSAWYSDEIQKRYDEHPTVDGTTVRVYQPSHEEYQRSKNKKHNMKALAEIYLLSMNDELITTGFSTFGYAAQGLAGLKPWIMFKSENHMVPDPPCGRAVSIEPCFHQAPYYDCKAKRDTDLGKVVPYVRHCEDVSWGLKIVNETQL